MSDRPVLVVDTRNRVRTLTFNRPEMKNAFNGALWDAVTDALAMAADDNDVACVILTGEGGNFCSGQDLREMSVPGAAETIAVKPEKFVAVLTDFDKPLIAAVDGVAVGIGLTMLGFCDIVVVAHGARMRAPFVTLGLTTEASSSITLVERLGWQEAAHLLFTASWLDAEAAVKHGLAWRAVNADELHSTVEEVAREIAAMPISSLRKTKQLMKADIEPRIRAAAEREAAAFATLLQSAAHAEALAAFAERREPRFVDLE